VGQKLQRSRPTARMPSADAPVRRRGLLRLGEDNGAIMDESPELTVVLPAHKEGRNLTLLLPQLREVLATLGVPFEILVVVCERDSSTDQAAGANDAEIIEQREFGFGGALREGFARARGNYVLTMDADLSHRPGFVADLWAARGSAEVLVASRYVAGGSATMPLGRSILSRLLNRIFSRGLGLSLRDMSSGFRLYDGRVLRSQQLKGRDFDVLQEILVKAVAEGWRVREVPFRYEPRASGSSNARVIAFGLSYLRTFYSLWKLRNSILSADYDDRAFDSVIFLQRYWQRRRFKLVTRYVLTGCATLDVGCGSSRIIGALPQGSVAVDLLIRKLRYARRFGRFLVVASGFSLPFADASFACVVCSQVIEHVPRDSPILEELCRVLRPGGRLILGTPDYGSWQWPAIEAVYRQVAPGAYADEHITHYTRQELEDFFRGRSYAVEATRYILHAELVLVLRKPR
jgi:dolichol-phosphate mannosyltransferase